MKLRVISNDEPPPTPKRHWVKERAGVIVPLLVFAALAGGLWFGGRWFYEPVSPAYIREQSPGYSQCVKERLSLLLSPITRFQIYKAKYVCDDSDLKAQQAQRDALGNVR